MGVTKTKLELATAPPQGSGTRPGPEKLGTSQPYITPFLPNMWAVVILKHTQLKGKDNVGADARVCLPCLPGSVSLIH